MYQSFYVHPFLVYVLNDGYHNHFHYLLVDFLGLTTRNSSNVYTKGQVSVVSTVGEKENGRLKIHANTKPKWRSVLPLKRVGFRESVAVRQVIHIDDYSDEEIAACWYDRLEFKVIKEEVQFVAKLLKEGRVQVDHPCVRGFEHKCPVTGPQKRAVRDAGIDAVLDEQDYQDDNGLCDQLYIARAYTAVTSEVADEAYQQGLRDQYIALQSYR